MLRTHDEYGDEILHECDCCGFVASGESARHYLTEVEEGGETLTVCSDGECVYRCRQGLCDHYTCTEGESTREWEINGGYR